MKKTGFIIFLLITAISLHSQSVPHWTKDSWRETQYPADEYLTGFSQAVKSGDEKLSKATENVKNLARTNLSKNVITHIQSVTESYVQSVETGGDESIKETFENEVKAETDAEINGVKVKSYYNEKDDYLYAFAYVKREKVISYYESKINSNIQKIESLMQSAESFSKKSEKSKATKEYEKCIPLFAKINYAQGILRAVDKNAVDSAGLRMQKSIKLHKEFVHKLSEVKDTYIYLDCSASVFDEETDELEHKLKAALAGNECSFTGDTAQADFLISVDATAREYNQAYNTYFSYVDARVDIKKAYNGEQIYQDKISQKGGSTQSYTSAAKEAYEDIIKEIKDKLLNNIK